MGINGVNTGIIDLSHVDKMATVNSAALLYISLTKPRPQRLFLRVNCTAPMMINAGERVYSKDLSTRNKIKHNFKTALITK